MSEQKQLDPERRKKIRQALARAEAFWEIIGKAGISLSLGQKIGKAKFDALSDGEKILLAKISTDLVKADNEIKEAFEAEEKREAQASQIAIDGILENAQEKQETPKADIETQARRHVKEIEETVQKLEEKREEVANET